MRLDDKPAGRSGFRRWSLRHSARPAPPRPAPASGMQQRSAVTSEHYGRRAALSIFRYGPGRPGGGRWRFTTQPARLINLRDGCRYDLATWNARTAASLSRIGQSAADSCGIYTQSHGAVPVISAWGQRRRRITNFRTYAETSISETTTSKT